MIDKNMLSLIGKDINGYIITKYIASGSFGNVFEAYNSKTKDVFALKIPIMNKLKNGEKELLKESKVYKILNNESTDGISKMKIITNKELNKKIIIMDLLGPSLEKLLRTHKKIRLKSIILIAIQMLKLVEYIHGCGYIHRDIKPDNFVMDNDNIQKLYCIDFGLAKKYLINDNKEHIPFKQNGNFCGTARYASLAAHRGEDQSRKDDLEAIGYLLVYLFKNTLPWINIKHKEKKERYRLIMECKENTTNEELCDQLPKEFLVYFKYVKSLDFDENPRYKSLINMFTKLFDSKNYNNNKLIWGKKNQEENIENIENKNEIIR